jgi:dCTP deaminase
MSVALRFPHTTQARLPCGNGPAKPIAGRPNLRARYHSLLHQLPQTLFPDLNLSSEAQHLTGILPSQRLRDLISNGQIIAARPIAPEQIQPSSIDLRLGSVAYRVRASFLPNEHSTVGRKLDAHTLEEISLARPAAFERGQVYVVPLEEELNLPAHISGKANPKSTTGRLDIFTRLLTDYGREFDAVPPGYKGKLYAEIVPGTFRIVLRQGDRLSQLRLSRGVPAETDENLSEIDQQFQLVFNEHDVPGFASIGGGLRFSVDLTGTHGGQAVGYRARRDAPEIDFARIAHYDPRDFWDPIYPTDRRDLVLNPEEFYILASREKVRIPPQFAAEMVPYDPSVGEFRIHYAGFFDPGFGYGTDDIKGTRAVLEVRSHEVPFLLEDGQYVGRLLFERLMDIPDKLYGQGIGSSYQQQGLALSKHFRPFPQ